MTTPRSSAFIIALLLTAIGAILAHGSEFRATADPDSLATAALLDSLATDDGGVLQGITVTAQRPLITKEIDRVGYDVAADPDSKTSNLRDILRKVPMVSVEADGTIKVNGSDNFRIYRNGRPNNAYTKNAKELFAAIPASTIRKVEVITDPGAREDADSSGLILNIVTTSTSSLSGVTGNVALNYDTRSDYPTGNVFIMTQARKLTLSASGGMYQQGRRATKGTIEQTTTYDATGNTSHYVGPFEAFGHGGWFNVEGSLELDTLNLITTALNGFSGKMGYDIDAKYTMSDRAMSPLYGYSSFARYPKNGYTDIDYSLDYQHSTRLKGETITLSYRLSHTNQSQVQNTTYFDFVGTPLPYDGIVSDYDMRFFEHTFQLDWSRPFGKIHKLDTGAKYIFRDNHSDNNQTLTGLPADDGFTTDEFRHRYHILGLYADYRVTLGRFSARAGLRYEYSRLGATFLRGEGTDFHSNLNDVVPNASLAWNVSDQSMLKLAYNRRIQRPGIQYLNPAVTITPNSVTSGNPYLHSSTNDNLTANYSLFKRKFNLDLSATFTASNDGFGNVQHTEGDVIYSTTENAMRSRRVDFSAFFQWTLTDKTKLMVNGQVNWARYALNTGAQDISLARTNGNIYTRISQELPWELTASFGAYYFSGWIGSPYTYSTADARSMGYNIDLKRTFLKSKTLDVQLRASNIGLGKGTHTSYTFNNGTTGTTRQISRTGASFGVSVSWRFGNLRAQVKKAANTIQNDDLEGRKK